MALSVVVFDVGETLVDEQVAYERWEMEDATTFAFAERDLHADALPCLGAAGNMQARHEDFLRPHVDFVGSSERWDVEKPDLGFFDHVVAAAEAPAGEILYVGDRVDNDVLPALAAGLRAVRIRRGAHVEVASPDGTLTLQSLLELPEVIERV
jgi:FMN phosphatase YigB (HAD superfamily)